MAKADCLGSTVQGRGDCLEDHRMALEIFWWGSSYVRGDCLGKRVSQLSLMVKTFARRQKRAERAAAQRKKFKRNPLLLKNHSLNKSAITNYHI